MQSLEERRKAGYTPIPTVPLQSLRSPAKDVGLVPMVRVKCSRPLLAQVAREHPRLRGPEVDDDEPVEGVAERVVGVESEQPAAELQVLLEQDRDALVVVLDLGDDARELLDVLQVRDLHFLPDLRTPEAKRAPRPHVAREARLAVVRPQVVDHQLARDRRVAVADADGPEQYCITRHAQDELPDSAPQKQQRGEAALVLGAHEGAPELYRRIELLQQPRSIPEERLGIQSALPVAGEDLVREPHAVRADDRLGLAVPDEQVQ